MKKSLLTTAVLASLFATAAMADPLPAGYAPGFTGAKLSTHATGIHKDVGLSITGMGVCKNFKINWGDSTEVVAEFDFGYGGSSQALNKTHQYTKGGKYFPSVAEITGPSLNERCGSRSDVPDSSVTITEPGKITAVTVTPTKAVLGQTVDVKVDGTGVCSQPRRILTEYRAVMNVSNNANTTVKTFAADEPWPRTASFTAAKEGYYVVYWLGTDSVSAPTGDCVSYFSPTFVEVKKANLQLPVNNNPLHMTTPVAPVGTTPAPKTK